VAISGGQVLYTPAANFNGTETFTYTISDGRGGTATATVTMTVTAVNDAPVASNASITTGETTAASGQLVANDVEANLLTYSLVAAPAGGSVVVNADGSFTFSPGKDFQNLSAGQSRTVSFTFAATDSQGAVSNTATVTVTVTGEGPGRGRKPKSLDAGSQTLAAGTDSGPVATAVYYDENQVSRFTVAPFSGFTGGVRVSTGDVTGDGIADLVAGTGPGAPSLVKVFDGTDGRELRTIDPFQGFTGGVFVSVGDLTGDGVADIVITPDEGGGPRVDIYEGATFARVASFFGIDDPSFRGGARSAVGDLNGDGRADLAVAAGFGGGPRVAVFDGQTITGQPHKLFNDFLMFDASLRNGVYVAIGDLDGDGVGELIGGAGPGGGPRVLALSGADLLNGKADQSRAVADFFAGDPGNRSGVRVAVKDLDGDQFADLATAPGAGAGSEITPYLGAQLGLGRATPFTLLNPFPDSRAGTYIG
jgi:VCBS repeat-containing protein